MSELTGQEIIAEIKGRLRNIENESLRTEREEIPEDTKKRLLRVSRHLTLQAVLSWITGQNKLREEDEPMDKQYIQRAHDIYHVAGEVEIDAPAAKVSRSEDGAFVSAWIWVSKEDAGGN